MAGSKEELQNDGEEDGEEPSLPVVEDRLRYVHDVLQDQGLLLQQRVMTMLQTEFGSFQESVRAFLHDQVPSCPEEEGIAVEHLVLLKQSDQLPLEHCSSVVDQTLIASLCVFQQQALSILASLLAK